MRIGRLNKKKKKKRKERFIVSLATLIKKDITTSIIKHANELKVHEKTARTITIITITITARTITITARTTTIIIITITRFNPRPKPS